MKAPVSIVCRHPAALGVALAGIAPIEAATGDEAAKLLPHDGLVLIEEELYAALPPATRRQLRRDGVPIVMPFPGPTRVSTGLPPEHELLEVLRRAVGYRLRLK